MNRNVSTPLPCLEAINPTVFQELRGADACNDLFNLNAVDLERQLQCGQNTEVQVGRVGERELEVATITYLRVSGLEGLGSPIISGVGSD